MIHNDLSVFQQFGDMDNLVLEKGRGVRGVKARGLRARRWMRASTSPCASRRGSRSTRSPCATCAQRPAELGSVGTFAAPLRRSQFSFFEAKIRAIPENHEKTRTSKRSLSYLGESSKNSHFWEAVPPVSERTPNGRLCIYIRESEMNCLGA